MTAPESASGVHTVRRVRGVVREGKRVISQHMRSWGCGSVHFKKGEFDCLFVWLLVISSNFEDIDSSSDAAKR